MSREDNANDQHEHYEIVSNLNNEDSISVLPGSISDEEKRALFKELTVLLTRSWEHNGKRIYGCSEEELLLITQFDRGTLLDILNEYKKFVEVLGLELVTYEANNDFYYCLRSFYYAPPELSEPELMTLGVIIALTEIEQDVTTQLLREKLVVTKRLTNYQLEEALRRLVKLGYIISKKRKWYYNYRTIIEFEKEERRKITEIYEKL